MSINIFLPIRIESVANKREHWSKRAARTKVHRHAMQAIPLHQLPAPPATITLTRIAPRQLDDDNCISGFKGVRDGIADRFGLDDGSPLLTWVYKQAKGEPKEYGIKIEIVCT